MKWGEQMEPRQETPVVENKVLSPAEVKNIIEELTRQNSRMAIIQQIAKRINVEMSYDDIIDEVAAPLRSVLPYDLLSFCLEKVSRFWIIRLLLCPQDLISCSNFKYLSSGGALLKIRLELPMIAVRGLFSS
jgi:hypothetical protein